MPIGQSKLKFEHVYYRKNSAPPSLTKPQSHATLVTVSSKLNYSFSAKTKKNKIKKEIHHHAKAKNYTTHLFFFILFFSRKGWIGQTTEKFCSPLVFFDSLMKGFASKASEKATLPTKIRE